MNQEVDLYMITIFHIDNKLKTLAPIFYSIIFVIYLGNNIIFGELLLGKAEPFQYVTITLCCSIVINYCLIKLCSQQQVYVSQEIHLIGLGFAMLVLSALLSYKYNVMPFYSIILIKGWIAQAINETHLLGEMYQKKELICFIGISIGAILCTFEWTFQFLGILFGWIGAASMVIIGHNLKKVKKVRTHTITQYVMIYTITILGLYYPIHKFGTFNIELVTYSIINGVLFPLCCTLFLHGFQIGYPSMNLAIFMLINMSGAALQIGHQFDMLSILGICICLISVSYLLLNHKSYIEVAGFEIEAEENPYYELNQYTKNYINFKLYIKLYIIQCIIRESDNKYRKYFHIIFLLIIQEFSFIKLKWRLKNNLLNMLIIQLSKHQAKELKEIKLGLDGDKEVALKFVQFSKEIEKEMQIHRGLNHKNLIKLLNFHVNEEYTKRSGKKEIKSCLVYDYMKDGELYEYLSQTGPFKEETARTFFYQLIDVLSYLHGQGLAHRDLKPENILFKDGQLKVSDLGFATFVGGNQGDGVLASFKGTISYMAPEILVRQKYVGQSVDIFAAGIILYLMLTAQLPFKQANAKDQLYNLICTNRFDQFWAYKEKSGIPRFSNELKTLINSMLAFDPLQRPTLSEIISTSWYQGATISNEIIIKLLNARKLKIQAQQDKENLQKLLDKQKRQAANQNQQLTVGIGNFKRGEEDITIDLSLKRELKRFKQTDVILPFEPNLIFVKLIENMDKFANKINYVDDKKYRLHYWFLQNNEEFEMAIQLVHGSIAQTVGLDFELIKGNGLEFYQKKQQVEDMLLQIE